MRCMPYANPVVNQRRRAAAWLACSALVAFPALAADPTPDPMEPYVRGASPVASVGLDLRVANDRRPTVEICSRQPGEIVR